MYRSNLFLALFALAIANSVSASSLPNFLDEHNAMSEIDKVIQLVCNEPQNDEFQISRVSTIAHLAYRFELGGSNGVSAECKNNQLSAIKRLHDIVEVSNDNVCSNEKISLIEGFHHDFISTTSAAKEDRKARGSSKNSNIAKILSMFFMHYATEVSITCRKNLVNNLQWDITEKFSHEEDLLVSNSEGFFNKLMNGVFSKVTGLSSVSNYDDVVLVWDMTDDPFGSEGGSVRGVVDEVTGEEIKLLVKMSEPDQMNNLKGKCASKMRPVYSQLILPIVRLANLGYSINPSDFEQEVENLRNSDLVRKWYGVTQICEAIMPIKFYRDPSMAHGQLAVISQTEADKLEEAYPTYLSETPIVYSPSTNSFRSVDKLTSVESLENQTLIRKLKTSKTVRERTVKRAIKRFAVDLKNSISGFKNKMFVSKVSDKSTDAFEQKDLSESVSKSVGDISEEELESLEGGASMTRRGSSEPEEKKGWWARHGPGIRKVFKVIGITILIIVLGACAVIAGLSFG